MIPIKIGPQHFHGRKVYIAQGYQEKLGEIGITADFDWLSLTPGTKVSNSNRVKAYRVGLADGSTVYFKTYSFHGQLFDYFLRQSKCAVEVNSYQTLASLGIPTIKPLAFGEDRVFGMLRSCFIVTEGIPETTELEKFALKQWQQISPEEKKKAFEQIFNETAKFTKMAHDANFFHYDLKWRNIIVRKVDGNYETIWIDCPRGRKMLFRGERGRMVDISSLARVALSHLTKSQRLRFLYKYYGKDATKEKVHQLWRKVDQHLSRRPPDIIEKVEKSSSKD